MLYNRLSVCVTSFCLWSVHHTLHLTRCLPHAVFKKKICYIFFHQISNKDTFGWEKFDFIIVLVSWSFMWSAYWFDYFMFCIYIVSKLQRHWFRFLFIKIQTKIHKCESNFALIPWLGPILSPISMVLFIYFYQISNRYILVRAFQLCHFFYSCPFLWPLPNFKKIPPF